MTTSWCGAPENILSDSGGVLAADGAPGEVIDGRVAFQTEDYLRIVNESELCVSDPVEIVSRPDHGIITIAIVARAIISDPELLAIAARAPAEPCWLDARARRSRRWRGLRADCPLGLPWCRAAPG
jgi:hypothetical protein